MKRMYVVIVEGQTKRPRNKNRERIKIRQGYGGWAVERAGCARKGRRQAGRQEGREQRVTFQRGGAWKSLGRRREVQSEKTNCYSKVIPVRAQGSEGAGDGDT